MNIVKRKMQKKGVKMLKNVILKMLNEKIKRTVK